jgi:hypothetical protein
MEGKRAMWLPSPTRSSLSACAQAESEGNYEEAKELYDQILADQPTNAVRYVPRASASSPPSRVVVLCCAITQLAMKRRAAVLRAQGLLSSCADELSRYCDIFSSDANAWEELAEVYVALEKYFPSLPRPSPLNHCPRTQPLPFLSQI